MITDRSAVSFANERIRPCADELARAYRDAKTILAYWQAKGMASLFPNDGTIVDDGAAAGGSNPTPDGRTPITGADVNALVGYCSALVADYEASGSAKLGLILKIAVNP